ncbi:hypothetical protein HBB16_16125 [Pseudonocardia sp. MCCB 268]|nr:hypothetical protein [Pseudonocardia cytotoxica]
MFGTPAGDRHGRVRPRPPYASVTGRRCSPPTERAGLPELADRVDDVADRLARSAGWCWWPPEPVSTRW